MAKYKVLVPVGKREKGPGYRKGDVFQDGDLPKETIEVFLKAGFIKKLPDKKAAAVNENEVTNNG